MKLATYADGTRDGQLWVVSRDLTLAVSGVVGNTPTHLAALENWDQAQPALAALSDRLNARTEPFATPFEPARP